MWLVLGGCGLLAIITLIIAIVVASNPSSDSDVGGAISTMADSTGDLDCSVYDAGSEERGACLSLEAGFDADKLGATFVTAYRVCSIVPPAEFPKQGFGHSKDPLDAAHAYAAEMFEYAYQGVAEEGCLAGFDDQS